MEISDIIALAGTVGGVQGLTEAVRWWQSRKLSRREDEASVAAVENENRRQQIDWLEKRLAERDAKIDAIYAELREEQSLRIGEIHCRHEAELKLADAEARKCIIRGCDRRQLPSEY
ncbi:MAG: hypothetical protein K2G13_01345 [Muribaculaceae bacterium]|nr:hypothetical protein [Muribaculaceae bacterium]